MKVEIPSLEELGRRYKIPKVGDWIEVVEWYRKGKFWVSDCFRGGETGEVANIFYDNKELFYVLGVNFYVQNKYYYVYWRKDEVKIIRRREDEKF